MCVFTNVNYNKPLLTYEFDYEHYCHKKLMLFVLLFLINYKKLYFLDKYN